MEDNNNLFCEANEYNYESNVFIEEETEVFEVAGTWGSLGTFGSAAGSCASSVGSASSFG